MAQGKATVIKNAGSHFLLSELPRWEPFEAVLKGKVRQKKSGATNPVAVGDRVIYSSTGEVSEKNPALIEQVLPRENYLIRRSTHLSRTSHIIAANIDQALIVTTLYFPEIKRPFLDRILLTCEVYGIKGVIVLNKVDLYRSEVPDQVEHFIDIYRSAGYTVLQTSTVSGEGIAELKELCRGKVSLLSGESGVGKSSLVNAIDPAIGAKTGLISQAHLQGKHTTSLYEMYRLDDQAFIIDTPGLRGFGLVDLEKEEIYKYFPEMLRFSKDCRFTPCTHTHEPFCAVKQAVDHGLISAERYNSYLGMLEEDKKFR